MLPATEGESMRAWAPKRPERPARKRIHKRQRFARTAPPPPPPSPPPSPNIHFEAGWTDSWSHRRCQHRHKSLLEAAECAAPHGCGWYVFAVEEDEPRELRGDENEIVDRFRFSQLRVSRYPDDCLGYRARAEAFWYEDRLSDAIRDYSRAIELNPTDILSRSGRGQVLAELGRSSDALGDLDFVLQLLDTVRNTDRTRLEWCRDIEAFVRRGRGVALAASGQIGDAMDEFAKSVTLKPDNAWVYYSRARVYDQQADRQQALADYSTAITESEPALTPIQRELARTRINALSR